MYKIYFFVISLLCLFSCQNDLPSSLLDSKTEDHINSLIDDMTIKEKVGQTCQITLDAILKKDTLGVLLEPHEIDQEKLNIALIDYNVGSILNVSNHTFSLEKCNNIIDIIQSII